MRALGRLLTCRRCGAHVDVIEVPVETIDPDQYACPDHWAPIVAAREAFEPPRELRDQIRDYVTTAFDQGAAA